MARYETEDGGSRWTRVVYVIELSSDACSSKKSHCSGDCKKTPVYVGETAQTAEERFAQHKRGYKSSPWVKKYGERLRPDLVGPFGEMASSLESQAAEVELAEQLRASGRFCVYGGH